MSDYILLLIKFSVFAKFNWRSEAGSRIGSVLDEAFYIQRVIHACMYNKFYLTVNLL